MRLEMYPVATGRLPLAARFLLRPSMGLAAWAEAHSASDATVSLAPLARLAGRLLDYLELGFAPSIANVPALAKYEQPMLERFTASRLVASLRLADERLSLELDQLGWSDVPVIASVAALHFDGGCARLVSTGDSFDMWHVSRGAFRWIRTRRAAGDHDGAEASAALVPTTQDVALADGDVLGLGFMPGVDARTIADRAAHIDELLTYLIACGETGRAVGVVCRLRA